MRGDNQWGEKNHQWKGDEVSYRCLHKWVHRNFPKPQKCPNCNQLKKLQAANISQQYKRDLSDWEWLCHKCHMLKDGRLEKLHSKENQDRVAEIQRLPENRKKRSLMAVGRARLKGRFI